MQSFLAHFHLIIPVNRAGSVSDISPRHSFHHIEIGPLQDPVTWHGINYAGTQVTQWDFQNKGKSGWTGNSSFVLEVPQRYLRPSVIYSVPCDRILQRAYFDVVISTGGPVTKTSDLSNRDENSHI